MTFKSQSSDLDIKVAEAQGWKYESNGVDPYWNSIYEWVTPEGKHLFRSDFEGAYQPSTNWKHTGWLLEKYNISALHVNGENAAVCGEVIADGGTTQEAICLAVIGHLGDKEDAN